MKKLATLITSYQVTGYKIDHRLSTRHNRHLNSQCQTAGRQENKGVIRKLHIVCVHPLATNSNDVGPYRRN